MRAATLLSLAALLAAACDSPLRQDDEAVCPQTYEFANYGCARVAGIVTRTTGQPIAGVDIRLIPPADPARGAYDYAAAQTGADGRFRIEIRRTQQPSQLPVPDTVTMTLRATESVANAVYTAEIPVVVTVRPVGEQAVVTHQDLSLQIP